MNFNKYCVPMVLLCVLLANEVKQTNSVDPKDAFVDSISLISGVAGAAISGPVGPVVVGALAILQLASKIFIADEDDVLSKTDFLESQSKIANALQKIDNHISEAYVNLDYVIRSSEIMNDMRNDLDALRKAYAHNIKIILDPNVTWLTKQGPIEEMVEFFSDFRQTLSSFVSKYIKPEGFLAAAGEVKLFFDFVLHKERIEVDAGDDCHSESTHTKLFKSYISIFKTLTESYAMVLAAYSVRYQRALKRDHWKFANDTQKGGLNALNLYKTDMKAFMGKAKWAMDTASREIRNCGKFELRRGETFESLSFGHTLPKFKDYNYDYRKFDPDVIVQRYECFTNKEYDVKYDDYEIDGKCTDGGFKKREHVKVFVNSTNSNWPYLYLELSKNWIWDKATYLGHYKEGPGIKIRGYTFQRNCYPLFCPAFKKNAIAISTQIVSAKPGNVITGLRFRKRENVLYIDIQEGKFIDNFSVDPKTVTWKETPKSNNILYLSGKIRKLELGAAELKNNQYLTKIQMKLKNARDGIIGFYVGGGRAPNWTTAGLTGSSYIEKSNEFKLSECDSPEQFGADVKNMISRVPVPSKPYHICFQPTDLKKDFGITTVPYIDIREVSTNPPAPIAGFGIYHQNVKGSGGYISLKLMALNFSSFIDYKFIEAINTKNKA